MKIAALLVVLGWFLLPMDLFGQQINLADTIKFISPGFRDIEANVEAQSQCNFVWNGNHSIDWEQGNGSVNYHLSIISVTSNILPGEIGSVVIADVTLDAQVSGQFRIIRIAGGVEIILYLAGGTNLVNNRYSIESFQKI